jgi:23S rRNA pseudouridine1911/1915/1917 synthase
MSDDELDPKIIYEDQHLVVLSKPAGLLSQGEKTGDQNLVDWLRHYFGRNYVGLIHRLDRNTSGIMIVAKRSKSAERLTRDLQEGKIYRSYLGWVEGTLGKGALGQPIRWSHLLWKDTRTNRVQVVNEGHARRAEAKKAILTATPVAHGTWHSRPVTLVQFVLETGRSHQIRAQAAHEKHPLLGDAKYQRNAEPDFSRPALHSHRLIFEHPMSHEKMEFDAPLPEDFKKIRIVAGESSL